MRGAAFGKQTWEGNRAYGSAQSVAQGHRREDRQDMGPTEAMRLAKPSWALQTRIENSGRAPISPI